MIDSVGRNRVLLGHANASGEREEHVVRYMVADNITIGELDGKQSKRLQRIADTFKTAGFPVNISKNMDA